jgi:hypothetical protein
MKVTLDITLKGSDLILCCLILTGHMSFVASVLGTVLHHL